MFVCMCVCLLVCVSPSCVCVFFFFLCVSMWLMGEVCVDLRGGGGGVSRDEDCVDHYNCSVQLILIILYT